MIKLFPLAIVLAFSFTMTNCSDDSTPRMQIEELAELNFPQDCTEGTNLQYISQDWEDSIGRASVYTPDIYLLRPDAKGLELFTLSSIGISTIESWTIRNKFGEEIFRQENFPTGDFEYGWNGVSNSGELEEGMFFSRVTFLSPTGIENYAEWTFCSLLCDGTTLGYHREDGLRLESGIIRFGSTWEPYGPFAFNNIDFTCQ